MICEARRRVGRRPIRPAAARHRVEVHRGIQRRAAPPVPLVRIRARLDQIRARSKWPLSDRHEQRRDAVRVARLMSAPPCNERARALDAAFARRVQQRREAAGRPVLRRGSAVTWRCQSLTARARVRRPRRAARAADHRGLALRGRPHQRRLPAPLLARIDLRAVLRAAARAASTLPVRATIISAVWPSAFGRLDVGARLRAAPRSSPRRRRSRLPTSAWRRSRSPRSTSAPAVISRFDELELVVVDGPVQRRRAVGVRARWRRRLRASAASAAARSPVSRRIEQRACPAATDARAPSAHERTSRACSGLRTLRPP